MNLEKAEFLINNFIEKNINIGFDYKSCMSEINKLVDFVNSHKLNFSLDFYINLVKNQEKLSNNLKVIVDNNINKILNYSFSKVFEDEMLSLLVESYCIINDIQDTKIIDSDNNSDFGEYIDEYKKYINNFNDNVLTKEEEIELFKRFHNGNESAKEELIKRNIKFVAFIALKFSASGIDKLDLIQEGTIGLMKAIDRFDENRGYKFSTYATWWIKQAILNLVYTSKSIKMPLYLNKMNIFLRKKVENYQLLYGKIPSISELSDFTKIPVKKIEEIQMLLEVPKSLDDVVYDNQDEPIINTIVDNDSKTIEDIIDEEMFKEEILKLLNESGLSKQSLDVIKKRNGINEEDKIYTLQEIADFYNLSRERIRQIEEKSYEILRTKKLAIDISNSYFGTNYKRRRM